MTEHTIRDEKSRDRIIQHLQSLDLKKPVKVTISPAKTSRSLAQNRLLWTWNNAIQQHMADSFGQNASAESWHDILASKLLPATIETVQMPDGSSFKVGRSRTSKLSVSEMAEYLTSLDAYCAENLSLLLPHPEDYEIATRS